MKPIVLMLDIHLPDQKIILTRRGRADAREIVDLRVRSTGLSGGLETRNSIC
jgi:hypothetical protein